MSSNSAKSEVAQLEAAMAERAPVLKWRLDPVRRVQVAWYVDDPYMTGGSNRDKTHCPQNHPYTEENTYITRNGRRCRTCKNQVTAACDARNPKVLTPEQRARKSELERQRRQSQREESPLLAAARNEI